MESRCQCIVVLEPHACKAFGTLVAMNKQLLCALCKACITISYNLSMLRCCMILSGVWLHHLKDLIVCNCLCFFFLNDALFYCFCLVIKTLQEVVFAARSVQSCFTPNNFQGSRHVSPKVDLGFVWTHVMQCKHRFTPGVDGTSATFAAGPNLPSHFPRVRWVTFFLPECCI